MHRRLVEKMLIKLIGHRFLADNLSFDSFSKVAVNFLSVVFVVVVVDIVVLLGAATTPPS